MILKDIIVHLNGEGHIDGSSAFWLNEMALKVYLADLK